MQETSVVQLYNGNSLPPFLQVSLFRGNMADSERGVIFRLVNLDWMFCAECGWEELLVLRVEMLQRGISSISCITVIVMPLSPGVWTYKYMGSTSCESVTNNHCNFVFLWQHQYNLWMKRKQRIFQNQVVAQDQTG